MSTPTDVSTKQESAEGDPYTIDCEGPECLYVLRFRGTYVDEGWSYSEVETARLLHAALIEAERAAHMITFPTLHEANGAILDAECDGLFLVAVWCDVCGAFHVEQGR